MTIIFATLLVGCVATSGGIQPPPDFGVSRPSNADNGDIVVRSSSERADEKVVRVWRDFSKSGDEKLWTKFIDEFIEAVRKHQTKTSGIEVVRFATAGNSIWQEKAEKFIWGEYPVFKDFDVNYADAPPNAKMFQDARKKYIDEKRAAYEKEKARIVNEYDNRVGEQLNRLRAYLGESPTEPARCTSFTELATRIERENIVKNLTITDGWADCTAEAGVEPVPAKVSGKHLIIQLPVHSDTQGSDAALKRREFYLRKLFPTADVFPVYSINKAVEELFR